MTRWLLVVGLAMEVLGDCTQYLSNNDLADYLTTTAQLEPQIASVYSIGFTYQNWDIPALELSAADPSDQVPNIKFLAGVHGDEAIGTQILISFIEHLLDGYRREERFVSWLLMNTRIHILPRLNLEGYELAIEGVCNLGPGRENSAGFDLNRVFPPAAEGVPEAEAVVSWLATNNFVLSAVIGAGELVVVYPPDDITNYRGRKKTEDDDVFRHLASVYTSHHKTMLSSPPCKGHFSNGMVSGAEWYPIKGSMQDYNYLYAGTMELTLEVGCCKYPPSDQICGIWEENKLALLKLAAESCRGVRGKVTSGGNPVAGAEVMVLGRNMTVRTNEQGYYFRILLPGRYFIKVDYRGHKIAIEEFNVPRSETAFLKWAVLDIQLEPEYEPTNQGTGFSYSTEQPTNRTVSYDNGGLDPYAIPTYDDSSSAAYDDLSSPDDGQLRIGHVKGAASLLSFNKYLLLPLCTLCKYLITLN